MPEIIVKGADTKDAMEKVQKLLGSDALILSTRKNGDFIEMTATDEMPFPEDQTTEAPSKNAIFSQMLQANLDARKSKPTAEPATGLTAADLKRERGIDLNEDKAPERAAPRAEIQPHSKKTSGILNAMTSARILASQQIVLCGSQGAGKSLVALQIAAETISRNPNLRPRLVFVGNGSRTDAAYLRDKANLIGVPLVFRRFEELGQLSTSCDQDIIVISGVGSTKLDDIRALNAENLILVLPSNLRASAAGKRLAMLEGLVSGVILTHCDEDTPDHDFIEALHHSNTLLVRKSFGRSMINSLFAVDQTDIDDWSQSAQDTAPSETGSVTHEAEPTAPQAPAQTQAQASSLPSLFRKRWGDANTAQSAPKITVPILQTSKRTKVDTPLHHEGLA